jgi:prepilin-type N-terminal cleavage/methylation domain-containing protein
LRPDPTRNLQSSISNLKSAFTLIELMLVVVITLLASALAIPSFVRSMRGAKLRASTRSVLMCHRYARSMAVLQQTPVAALFDTAKAEIEIVSVKSATDDREKFLDDRGNRTGVEAVDNPGTEPAEAEPAKAGVESELIRPLEGGVRISSFESEKVEQERDGIYWVNYYPNGMCDPYTVTIEDEYHKSVQIKVDPLSGKAEVERD